MNKRSKRLCVRCGRPHWRSISVFCVDCDPASRRTKSPLPEVPLAIVAQRVQSFHLRALGMARRQWYRQSGIPLEELEGEALCVLVRVARRFDPARGIPFSHLASACIARGLRRCTDNWLRQGRLAFPRFSELSPAEGPRFDAADSRAPSPASLAAIRESLCRMQALFTGRYARDWDLLWLRYGHGYTLAEVAAQWGVSRAAVHQREVRALARARRLLHEEHL